jgi:hypothetical protein
MKRAHNSNAIFSTKPTKFNHNLTDLLRLLNKNSYQAFTHYLIGNQISILNLSQLLQKTNPVQLHYLGKALQGTSVVHLDVSTNYLTNDEVLSLIQSLSNTQVSEINFSLNDITGVMGPSYDATLNTLSNAWINCLNSALLATKIEKLDFSCNDLSTAGASTLLAATLATQVTNINFAGNCIGKQHMDLLAQNLIHCPITNLNLSLNKICYTGLVKLSTRLPSSSLTILNLSLNPELNHGAAALLKTILPHTQLIELNLDNTNISTIEQKELAALIEHQRIKLIEEMYTSIQQDLATNHYCSYLPLQDITNQSNPNRTSYNIAEKNSSKVSSNFNFK